MARVNGVGLRVLVSAYACEPGRGSEPGVGWHWVREIAQSHEVWTITRANNRKAIESALAVEPLPNVHWVYFDLPGWARFWKKGARGIRLYYFLWQLGAFFVGRKLLRRIDLDLIHHLTLGTYWMPSFLSLLPVPFIWGPVGGGESAPRSFRSSFRLRGKLYELLRDVNRALGELNPLVRLTARRAVVALSKTEDTQKRLETLGSPRVLLYSEVGLPADEIDRLNSLPSRQGNGFRLVSLGRLIHWKGFELGLKAFAQFHSQFPASEYWLIGDGPERKRLESLVQKLGVANSVRFLGSLSRAQVLERLAECDVLVHPSLHDSGGWACVEAMAAGRPVICLDLGGPAVQVTKETGVKVPAGSPQQVVRDLAAAMNLLAADRVRRERMGTAARKRVRECFCWDKKAEWLNLLYSLKPGTPMRAGAGCPQPDVHV
jgi:glycosyltransferase involved in cell wall biosynthesis